MNAVSRWAALVFVVSAAVTVIWCGSMAAMPGMEMPGGWTMSMAWMRMPGQSWLHFTGSFTGMWALMMMAMMMPVLRPVLTRYHAAEAGRANTTTACVALGYFAVWSLSGLLVFPVGLAYAELAMRVPAVAAATPLAAAGVVLVAGALQFSAWKSRRLACCRGVIEKVRARAGYRTAWRHGVRAGLRCFYCCAPLTAVLLVIGVMDLLAMALVTMAISAERLMKDDGRAARMVGAALLGAGAWMLSVAMRTV